VFAATDSLVLSHSDSSYGYSNMNKTSLSSTFFLSYFTIPSFAKFVLSPLSTHASVDALPPDSGGSIRQPRQILFALLHTPYKWRAFPGCRFNLIARFWRD
jgi:hypothetical protein